ncbi:adenylate/guanylate cyclase domain-containing protein, partial [Nostoc sp. NIES-2111]
MVTGRSERRLAAIMAADVVGYSGRIEANEAATLAGWRAVQDTVIHPAFATHGGRVVKLLGDGFIAEFSSVVEAVECAANLQTDLARSQSGQPESERLRLRIGVNVGDVVAEAGDLLGDAVNIAARLEQMCPPGGLLISASAHEQLVGKTALRFASLGPQQLKNIKRTIEAFRLDTADGARNPARSDRQEKPVVAVLPFENLSSDPEQGYFSDGIAEDMITDLSRFREIVVVARNSSFSFRGRAGDLRSVGQQLGADYLVEGSVRLMGRRVRINAQLIEEAT